MRYFRALSISLGIHVVVAIALMAMPVQRLNPRQTTLVELVEEPELPRRPRQPAKEDSQFVRSVPVPPDLLTKQEREKRFSSEHEQNILEEQKARESGMTANRSPEGANDFRSFSRQPRRSKSAARGKLDLAPESPLDKAKKELLEDPTGEGGVRIGGVQKKGPTEQADGSKSLSVPNFAGAEKGLSTLGEALPDDIKVGDFTALNTDRNLYYTFYSRMEEKIRNRWENYVRAAFFGLSEEAKKRINKDTYTTKLEIVLDKEGNFKKALLHGSSGMRSLDSAPVQAFREAGQFPNPPQEMIKDDGTIRIEYAFTVQLSSRVASSRGADRGPASAPSGL